MRSMIFHLGILMLVLTEFIHVANGVKVALCFIGLTRSLQYTLQNIRSNVMDPITEMGYEYDVFLHSYNMSYVTNPSTGENAAKMQWEKYNLLQPKLFQIDDVTVINDQLFNGNDDLSDYYKFDGHSGWYELFQEAGPHWGVGQENLTVMNMIKQLWSAKHCTQMWTVQRKRFDAVIYLRSDVWFFNPLNASILAALEPDTLYLPDWGDNTGLHDRIAIGTPEVMVKYGSRFDILKEFCKGNRIHSEIFVQWTVSYHKMKVDRISLHFERVRANGSLMACCEAGSSPCPCRAYDGNCGTSKLKKYTFVQSLLNYYELQDIPDSQ